MNEGLIPKRYAKALLKFAAESKQTGRVYELMGNLNASFASTSGLSATVRNPFVSDSDKIALLTTAAGAKTDDSCFADFLKLLIRNRRMPLIREIALAYCSLYRKANNISVVEITTAYEPDTAERKRLKSLVESNIGNSKVELSFVVDPAIIGGFVITIDSRRLDASVSNEFKQLRQKLLKD